MVTRKKATVTRAYSRTFRPWKELTLQERIREVVMHADHQKGHAVTLNFSVQFEEYVRAHHHPMRQIQKRINRELSKVNLQRLPLLLVLETADGTERPHLHGVFIPSEADVDLVKYAMRRAVGYVESYAGSRQIKLRSLFDPPIGWANYFTENFRQTRKALKVNRNEELVWVSHTITRAAREHYESVRLGRVKPANHTTRPNSTAV